MGKRVHLTKRVIDQLMPRESRYTVWDDEPVGFGVRVEMSGAKTFILSYTTKSGRRRRMALGRYGALTIDQARDEAKVCFGRIIAGADPLQEKQDVRAADTLKDFAKEYLEYAKAHKKPASLRADTYALDEMIVPILGSRKLSDVSREDVADSTGLMRSTRIKPTVCWPPCRTCSRQRPAGDAFPQGQNPCLRVAKYRETKRTRFLAGDELPGLGRTKRPGSRAPLQGAGGAAAASYRLPVE